MVLRTIGLTGATGMVGRHLRAALEAGGARVVACSREPATGSGIAAWNLCAWRAPEELDALFRDVQAVVHAGAMVPRRAGPIDEPLMFDANVRSCVNLGQWAMSRNIPLVQVSGAIVYQRPDQPGLDENAPLGWSGVGGFYGLSKLLAEDALGRLRSKGLRLAVVRPSSIYGAGLPEDKMLASFLGTARGGGTITLAPPVDDRFDLIHAADVALAIREILLREEWDVFNLASGQPPSVREMAEACVQAAGRGDVALAKGTGPARQPFTRFAMDTSRAGKRLDWRPLADLGQGLRMMLAGSLLIGAGQPA